MDFALNNNSNDTSTQGVDESQFSVGTLDSQINSQPTPPASPTSSDQGGLASKIESASSLEELKGYIKEAIDAGMANDPDLIEKANSKKNQLTSLANNSQPIIEPQLAAEVQPKEDEANINVNYSPIESPETVITSNQENFMPTPSIAVDSNTPQSSPTVDTTALELDQKIETDELLIAPSQPAEISQNLIQNQGEGMIEPLSPKQPTNVNTDQATAEEADPITSYRAEPVIDPSLNSEELISFDPAETTHTLSSPQNFLETEMDQSLAVQETESKIPETDPVIAHEKDILKEFNELMGRLVVLASESAMLLPEDKMEASQIGSKLKDLWADVCTKRAKSLDDEDSKYILQIIDQQLSKI